MLTVGIPKEIKSREKRVALVPKHAALLSRQGIRVVVEKDAGRESGFTDEDYQKSGATILPDAGSVYAQAELIQKVKEPQPAEFSRLRSGQILFCFLHLASPENGELVRVLVKSGVTAIGYETVEQEEGRMPLLAPMSEIAGGLAALYAAFFLDLEGIGKKKIVYPKDFQNRLEAIAGCYPLVPPSLRMGRAMIFGCGVAGQKALEFCLKMRGEVTGVEKNPATREFLRAKFQRDFPAMALLAPEENLEPALEKAEVLIGCVHAAGRRAAQVIRETTLNAASARQKKIVMDVAIDQGGNFPGPRATDYDDPLYRDKMGNLRFAVANMPSLCGRGASERLSEAAFPYGEALARDPERAFQKFPELARAINVKRGKLANFDVQDARS